ncbi:MAG: glucose-6-phosphate isomerase family protein [Pelolinea sp.]|nr:glucose-6-phosphate isomerase family protein [Pelolinea sp.]
MNLKKEDYPVTVLYDFDLGEFSPKERSVARKVSDLSPMFHDKAATEALIKQGDPLVYEIFYYGFKTSLSDMALGTTRIQPGKVGDEYYMTKGHFHAAENQPEIYFCVKGQGNLLMQTIEGEFLAERWKVGTISHIPPMWAHRVVNTGNEPLVFVASYHLSAGHNYGPIEEKGFRKLLVERNGKPEFVLNEQWK